LADDQGKVLGSPEESLRLAQHADRIGFDAVIPVCNEAFAPQGVAVVRGAGFDSERVNPYEAAPPRCLSRVAKFR